MAALTGAMWRRIGIPIALGLAIALPGACSDPVAPPPSSGPAPPGTPVVRFEVVVPASTPAGDTLWISGNAASLGNWSGRGLPLAPLAGGLRAGAAPFERGTPLEFKVTRGSWNSVEKGPMGEEIPNRKHVVDGSDTLRIDVAAWRDQTEGPPPPSVLTGTIRRHRNVPSQFLALSRDVIVYLPPGHDAEPARRFPVLYMHDGQNLMDAATSFAGVEWGMDETAQRLIEEGRIEPLIIVGIYNSPDRIAEYTPAADHLGRGGNAENYARFLVEELKPFIDATYRTDPGAAHTGTAGSSLGGIVSMHLGLAHSGTFTRIGAVSPAVWFADHDIVTRVRAAPKRPLRIWMDIGTAEDGSGQALNGARLLRDALIERGFALDDDLRYVEAAGAAHNEAAWAARVEPMLLWLFPAAP